ncbi:MAG: S1C family serine protease, partial [Planctomycetales bacterium]
MMRLRLLFVILLFQLVTAAANVPLMAQPASPKPPREMTVVELVRAVENSIVRVDIVGVATVFDQTAKTLVEKQFDATMGTGFVIRTQPKGVDDLDVYIVTNSHVVQDARTSNGKLALFVRTAIGKRQKAELVGVDELSDLAVLRIRVSSAAKSSLPALEWNSKRVQVGEEVVAVGFGQVLRGPPSVTKGIVSATDRFLTDVGRLNGRFAGLIQTDA